jgi:RecB family exonuclease
VVHVLAEYGAQPDADVASLTGHLDAVWDQLDFDANWLSAAERLEAEAAVERFVAWHQARSAQQLLGTEVEFGFDITVAGERIRLTGTADRVERDPDGRIRIVDFKTFAIDSSASDVALQDQLGVYQLAVAEGALAGIAGDGARPGGAGMVYLRLPDGNEAYPRVFHQSSLDDLPFPAGREPVQSSQGRECRRSSDLGPRPTGRGGRGDPSGAL